MATHIKTMVDGPNGNDSHKPVAREDWINDLEWLRHSCYRKTLHAFKWPCSICALSTYLHALVQCRNTDVLAEIDS